MRCVSYTRTTSCKNTKNIPSDIIQQQNEHIQNYIQSHGWKLVAKYSDRKKDENENTAFEEMTADGINRKFDMVVVDSVDRCGKYISCKLIICFYQIIVFKKALFLYHSFKEQIIQFFTSMKFYFWCHN